MRRTRVRGLIWIGLTVCALTGGAAVHAGVGLEFDVPGGWAVHTPSSSVRLAEFTLPRAAGDAEDASLVVYDFGGTGGSVAANVARWIGQMAQPDGAPSESRARTSVVVSNHGLKMTVVDVPGTYVAEVTPGSTERFNKPGYHLRAAVIETSEGPYFVKLVGPAATVARWDDSFRRFLQSMRTGGVASRPGEHPPASSGLLGLGSKI